MHHRPTADRYVRTAVQVWVKAPAGVRILPVLETAGVPRAVCYAPAIPAIALAASALPHSGTELFALFLIYLFLYVYYF